jgi:hypothetical protein
MAGRELLPTAAHVEAAEAGLGLAAAPAGLLVVQALHTSQRSDRNMHSDQDLRDDLESPPGTDASGPMVGINADVDVFGDPHRTGGEGGTGVDHATNFYGTGTDDLRAGTRNDPNLRSDRDHDRVQPDGAHESA